MSTITNDSPELYNCFEIYVKHFLKECWLCIIKAIVS